MMECNRQDDIVRYLREQKTVTVANLAHRLYASEATIRRDLTLLEKKGLVKRVHGGAVLAGETNHELPLYLREQQNVQAKKAIAAQAAGFLEEGQTIFLDASSTVMFLIPYFEKMNQLTIVTNGLKTGQELCHLPHTIYCTGGLMLHNSSAYVGSFAEAFIRHFNADLFFFSSRGLSDDGKITDASSEETHIRQVMMQNSKKHIFMCDTSKNGKLFCYNLCKVSEVDAHLSEETTTDEPAKGYALPAHP